MAGLAVAALGCDRGSLGLDMYEQPRYEPYEGSAFFQDGQSARPLVPGTVAREEVYLDRASHGVGRNATGMAATEGFPADFPTGGDALRATLEQGQKMYNINCSLCHGFTGHGDGMIVQRGFTRPPPFVLLERDRAADPQRYQRGQFLQSAPPSHVYNVITNGFGAMYSYADRVSPQDRWAIAAYVKVLQQAKPEPAAPAPPVARTGQQGAEKTHP